VVVLAESMGTVTGLVLVKRRPDLFHALVVTDLYVNMAANEARKHQLTLERLRAAGTTKGVAALRPDPAARRGTGPLLHPRAVLDDRRTHPRRPPAPVRRQGPCPHRHAAPQAASARSSSS
jgi:pimeloyl-ACP methyl ester carboxylesterase